MGEGPIRPSGGAIGKSLVGFDSLAIRIGNMEVASIGEESHGGRTIGACFYLGDGIGLSWMQGNEECEEELGSGA